MINDAVEQEGRRLVQFVGVVYDKNHSLVAAPGIDCPRGGHVQLGVQFGGQIQFPQKTTEGSKGHVSRALRRPDGGNRHASITGQAHGLSGQPSLTETGCSDESHAGTLRIAKRIGERTDFCVTSDYRPHRSEFDLVRHCPIVAYALGGCSQ